MTTTRRQYFRHWWRWVGQVDQIIEAAEFAMQSLEPLRSASYSLPFLEVTIDTDEMVSKSESLDGLRHLDERKLRSVRQITIEVRADRGNALMLSWRRKSPPAYFALSVENDQAGPALSETGLLTELAKIFDRGKVAAWAVPHKVAIAAVPLQIGISVGVALALPDGDLVTSILISILAGLTLQAMAWWGTEFVFPPLELLGPGQLPRATRWKGRIRGAAVLVVAAVLGWLVPWLIDRVG